MLINWTHLAPTLAASFLGSLVEFVEALTVVVAVGTTRGWRPALMGTAIALSVLLVIVAILGPALTRIPLGPLQLVAGTLLLLFGMRWLRKAVLRASGVLALHDESVLYKEQEQKLRRLAPSRAGLDVVAVATAFKITMLEGIEVAFIVIALGAAGAGLLLPACAGALVALLTVVILGAAIHRPLSKIPENTLKFAVGVLLSAFGTFWVGEGLGLAWPRQDWSIVGLVVSFLLVAMLTVPLCRSRAARNRGPQGISGNRT